MKIREIIGESLDYQEGDCPIFAIALHRLTGYPLMAIVEYNERMRSTVLVHAYVRGPNGWDIDSNGETNVEDILDRFPNDGNAEEVQISEKDLLEIGYGKSPVPPLSSVLPDAQEVIDNLYDPADLP